jgi:hypothetical protein
MMPQEVGSAQHAGLFECGVLHPDVSMRQLFEKSLIAV